MSDEVLIKVEGASKKFCRSLKHSMFYGVQDICDDLIGRSAADRDLRENEFWAVNNVSFELRRGECLGLIGHNGAGKTTLLKMLNGLIKPDRGNITIKGRTGALIALGAGFNPILTGRENIYVNAAVLGLSKKETDAKLDEIIEFAEIAEFIDAPVQTYSSGMKVRLGFAIASSLEPDVLILDEVLAVGDVKFQNKCFNRIDTVMRKAAVIFVSHQMANVSRVTNKAILMKQGLASPISSPSEAIDLYYRGSGKSIPNFKAEEGVEIHSIRIREDENFPVQCTDEDDVVIHHLHDLTISFTAVVPLEYPNPEFYLAIYDQSQVALGEAYQGDQVQYQNTTGSLEIEIRLPRILFSKGLYSITLAILAGTGIKCLLRYQSVAHFRVKSDRNNYTPLALETIFSER